MEENKKTRPDGAADVSKHADARTAGASEASKTAGGSNADGVSYTSEASKTAGGSNEAGVSYSSGASKTSGGSALRTGCGTVAGIECGASHYRQGPRSESTQLTPDDQLRDGGAMPCDTGSDTPSWREVEQDTVALNPSVESMDSRG